MSAKKEQITFAEAMQAFISSAQTDIHVAMPGKIQSYDASTQTADIVPMINRSLPNGKDNWITEFLPVLADVPICFPRGGGFFVSMPIQAGDYVMLVFAERNISYFMSTGNQGDPGDLGMHTLDGAMAIPIGPFPSSSPLASADATNMELGSDLGVGKIEITSAGTSIGGNYSTTVDYQLLGTTFRSAQASLDLVLRLQLPLLSTALGNLGSALTSSGGAANFNDAKPFLADAGAAASSCTAIVTAMDTAYETFEAAAASYLSSTNKVK